MVSGLGVQTLFLIRKKYHDLGFSDIDFSTMEGHDIPDLYDGIDAEGGAEDADQRRWQAGEDERVEFAVARAREEALQEAQRWRDGEEERINSEERGLILPLLGLKRRLWKRL